MSQFHQLTKNQPESVTKLNLPGNTSVVLLKKETIEVRDEPLPILQPDGVLVKVISTDKSPSSSYQLLAREVWLMERTDLRERYAWLPIWWSWR